MEQIKVNFLIEYKKLLIKCNTFLQNINSIKLMQYQLANIVNKKNIYCMSFEWLSD